MSKARLAITAVVLEGRSQSEVARAYGVSQPWISRLVARYRAEGEAAFTPRSRRPRRSPSATDLEVVELILRLRKQLAEQGLDAGPHTICWHLAQHHQTTVSAATVSRILTRHGQVTPEPHKRPKASYLRFEAELPNQMWQTDFTHYRLSTGRDVEILSFLDDHSRLLLACVAFDRVTGPAVVTLRHHGRLHHIGIGRTHARTHVLLLVQDRDIRVIDATTGALLRELVLDPTRDYQPRGTPRTAKRPNP